MFTRFITTAFVLGALAPALHAQTQPAPITLTRLAEPIVFDGRPDERAWQPIAPFPFSQYNPISGATPSEASDVRLAYDDEYLYVAGRFDGSHAADRRSGSLTRDRLSGDNTFTLLLDTFADRENALLFATNPAGIRVDAAVAGDGASHNMGWNTYWDVVTDQTATGWTMEMRIPFSSLRFQPTNGQVVMGMILTRYIAKDGETVSFPLLSQSFSNAAQRASLAQPIVLENIRSRTPIYATPYALTGASRSQALSPDRTRFIAHDEAPREVGLDVKYSPTSNLTLDVTVNTDFAQAEADDQQVNLTRYPLFYPDRRQFFQERAGVLEFNMGGDRLFHSRRIGLSDAGEPLRIYGGVRGIGRVGGWDYGMLNMQTETPDGDGSENFGVMRLRRAIWKPGSTVGAALTSRLGGPNGHNIAYGTDLLLRPFSNDYVSMQWAQTFDDQAGAGLSSGTVRAAWERRAERGFVYSANARWIGDSYSPELGFFSLQDRTTVGGNVRYGWYPGEATIFRNIQPSINTNSVYRNDDGTLESRFISNFLNFALKGAWTGFVVYSFNTEDLQQTLNFGGGAAVPAGTYDYGRTSLNLFSPGGKPLRMNTSIGFGEFYDGRQTTVSLSPTLNLGGYVEVGAEYHYNRVEFDSRDQSLNADIARLRLRAALDSRLSGAALVQYNKLTNTIAPNLRLRYHFGEGRDLYIVYNDQVNRELVPVSVGGPVLPRSLNRALLVKYSYTFAY